MITSVVRQALRTRGEEPALLCHTGEHRSTREALAGLRLRATDRLIDLDTHRLGEPVTVPGVGGEGEPEAVGLVAVVAASLTDLRRSLTTATHLPPTVHLVAAVADTPGHQGPLIPAPPGIDQWHGLHELRARRFGKRGWICELYFPDSVETAASLDHVLSGTGGRRRGPRSVPLGAVHGTEGALWRSGDVSATGVGATGPIPLRRVTPIADLVARVDDGTGLPAWQDPAVPHLDVAATGSRTWAALTEPGPVPGSPSGPSPGAPADTGSGSPLLRVTEPDPVTTIAPIDERAVNPAGFTKKATGPIGDLTVRGEHASVCDANRVLFTIPADGTVTDLDLGYTRYLCGLRVDWSGHSGPTAAVRAVASLAAGGVPLLSGPVPAWAAGLGSDLTGLLTSATETALRDPLTREEHSVRLRRAALRTHGQTARWRSLAERAGVPVPPEPRMTVMLCTRRPEMVGFALAQIARQRGVRFEVVLALHGFPAALPQVRSAIDAFSATGVPVTVYEAEAERVFGSVLNEAADRASGTVIAKWDDDDWYGPDHLADMALARTYSGGDIVGISQDLVYLEELDLTVLRSYRAEKPSPDVVGSTITIDRSVLEEVGGFRPLPRAIDSQLLFAVRRNGGRIYRTHGLGYLLRRAGQGHTWSADLGYFLRRNTRQWSGWRPSALMEGAVEPLGATERTNSEHTSAEYTGGHR